MTFKQKTSYALGDVADGIQGVIVNTFLLFYLTTTCGMPGSLAGLALAITLVIEAGTTPVFGYLSDRTRTRWGRRHPYMFAAAAPLALSIGLIFSVPTFEAPAAMFAYVLAVLVVLRASFSAFALPYAALGAELSPGYEERAVIMSYRNAFNILGALAGFVLGFGVFLNGIGSREAYFAFGWTCAALVLVSTLAASVGSLSLARRAAANSAAPRAAPADWRVTHEIAEMFRNPSFRVLFLVILCFSISQGCAESLAVHMLTYFWQVDSDEANRIFIFRVVGMAGAVPLYAPLLRRIEKRELLMMTITVGVALQLALPALAIAELLPRDGLLEPILYLASLINGAVLTFLFISIGSMTADAIDEHEWRCGARREGLYFAGLIFFGKCALSIGTLIAGIALELIGFSAELAARPEGLPSRVVLLLGLMAGPGAALIGSVAVVALKPYRLDRHAHARIRAALAGRRPSA